MGKEFTQFLTKTYFHHVSQKYNILIFYSLSSSEKILCIFFGTQKGIRFL